MEESIRMTEDRDERRKYVHGVAQGCSPKKEVGGCLKQDLDKDFFKQFRPTYTYSYTSEKFCCTEIILHCVSVSKQLQQWTNFCMNFSPKKWGKWGSRPPLSKKAEGRRPSAPLHPWCGQQWDRGRLKNRPDRASLVPCISRRSWSALAGRNIR